MKTDSNLSFPPTGLGGPSLKGSPIANAMQDLKGALEEQAKIIGELENRLGPVLACPEPCGVSPECCDQTNPGLAYAIRARTGQTIGNINALRAILDRLEL